MINFNQAIEETIQTVPDARRNKGAIPFGRYTRRGPLLPHWGTREREFQLRQFWRHDYNTIFTSAVAGLVKVIQSTPWEITTEHDDGDYWQQLLMNANFGSWDNFLSELITDYSRQDAGAFIEIIGAGDPLGPIAGRPSGIAILDSLRCFPTGDPRYPIVYYDGTGFFHLVHHTRVIQWCDTKDSDEDNPGYGYSALSRAIAPVMREILMGRYIESSLDDKPPPGILLMRNITEEQHQAAIEKMHSDMDLDSGGVWGRTVRLYGMMEELKPEAEYLTFSQPPEKFDFDTYKTINVKEIALAIGLDIQDVWELSGAGIGTGTQSEVLHRKSKGRAIGRIYKSLERVINQFLPVSAEFRFKYRDTEEDQERAQIANTWSSTVQIISGVTTPDEQRRILVDNVEAFKDALTDDNGDFISLDDADPRTPQQQLPKQPAQVELPEQTEPQIVDDTERAAKALQDTRARFKAAFRELITFAQEGVVPAAAVRVGLRAELVQRMTDAALDGMRTGGVEAETLPRELSRKVRQIVASQRQFIERLAREIVEKQINIDQRAEFWANKAINQAYFEGVAFADANGMYEWQIGSTKEHCRTCLTLNGQRHLMKTYLRRGLLPNSGRLECGGWNCKCRLVQTTGRARGRIRAVPIVRFREMAIEAAKVLAA